MALTIAAICAMLGAALPDALAHNGGSLGGVSVANVPTVPNVPNVPTVPNVPDEQTVPIVPNVALRVVSRNAPEAGNGLLTTASRVDIEVAHGPVALIHGWWWQTDSPGPASRPVVMLLHGCGGMLNRKGQPDARTLRYAALLLERGWHVLAVDSFSARGTRQICTRRRDELPAVDQTMRRDDVTAAISWLGRQDRADPSRIALVGWSNGGSTVLEYTHQPQKFRAVEQGSLGGAQATGAVAPGSIPVVAPGLRLAAAFYPGCASRLRRGYEPALPVLLLLGLSDDWTPAQPCLELASQHVTVHGWEQAYHGFDGDAPLRFRTDIRTGIRPEGVHHGSNPAAGERARSILLAALERALSTTALNP